MNLLLMPIYVTLARRIVGGLQNIPGAYMFHACVILHLRGSAVRRLRFLEILRFVEFYYKNHTPYAREHVMRRRIDMARTFRPWPNRYDQIGHDLKNSRVEEMVKTGNDILDVNQYKQSKSRREHLLR